MPPYIRTDAGGKTVTYFDNESNQETRTGGSRSWRNKNPDNIVYGGWAKRHGAIGKDRGGFAIFPDETSGLKAKEDLIKGKYGDYDSIREMLKGKSDRNGKQIPNTGYAPERDKSGKIINDPEKYANDILKWTGIDVEKKKIQDLTDEEMQKLLDAMNRKEGWKPGHQDKKDSKGKLVPISSNNIGDKDTIMDAGANNAPGKNLAEATTQNEWPPEDRENVVLMEPKTQTAAHGGEAPLLFYDNSPELTQSPFADAQTLDQTRRRPKTAEAPDRILSYPSMENLA